MTTNKKIVLPMTETQLLIKTFLRLNSQKTKERLEAIKDFLLATDLCFSAPDRTKIISAFTSSFEKKQNNYLAKKKEILMINWFPSGAFPGACSECKKEIASEDPRFSIAVKNDDKKLNKPSKLFCSSLCCPAEHRLRAQAAQKKRLAEQAHDDKKLN